MYVFQYLFDHTQGYHHLTLFGARKQLWYLEITLMMIKHTKTNTKLIQ